MVSIDIYIGIDKERAWLSYEFTRVICTGMMDDDSVGDQVYIWPDDVIGDCRSFSVSWRP